VIWDIYKSRNDAEIAKLDPAMQHKVRQLMALCRLVGVYFLIVSGYRSDEEQNELFAQGRTKPGKKVTWVRGGDSLHQYGVAIDVVPVAFFVVPLGHTTPDKSSWIESKLEWAGRRLFDAIARIAKHIGMDRPYRDADRGHLTYAPDLNIGDLRAGKRPDAERAAEDRKNDLRARMKVAEDALHRDSVEAGRKIELRRQVRMLERQIAEVG